MMKSGIYQINCKNSKEFYIGSAKDLNHRWNTHLYCLKNNKHHNIILQRKFNKYGEENFEFKIPNETGICTQAGGLFSPSILFNFQIVHVM